MSYTRWSARSDAMRALFKNYSEIIQSLINIAEHPGQTPSAIQETKSLAKKIDSFEIALMCTIWNDLLQNLNIVNKATQEPGIELGTVVRLYDSLLTYLSEIRTQFNTFELEAKELSECDYKNTRKCMRKFFFDEDSIDATADTVSNMSASDRFQTQTFYPIINKLIKEMGRRREAYSMLDDRFGFLVDKSMSRSELISKAGSLVHSYSSDLEEYFIDEFLLFSNMYSER